jgi:hypothetical protein
MASTASPLQAPITDLHGHPTSPSVPDLPFDLYLSSDPFDYTIQIKLPIKGDHTMLGMELIPCPLRGVFLFVAKLP